MWPGSGHIRTCENVELTIIQAAEAYMSLGNVSSPRTNEQYFRRALQLLQRASQVQGYSLPRHLQKLVPIDDSDVTTVVLIVLQISG
jgi:hypothetical protein